MRVALAASGVCHSDLSVANGTLPLGAPIVLGHEGAGVIAEIGPEVDGLAVGDHVVLSWVPQCGTCWSCRNGDPHLCTSSAGAGRHLSVDGEPVQQMMGLGTFATETTVPVSAVVRIPSDVPLAQAALVGCAVLTGAGAAMNTAHLEPGGSVAVIGCGGVGLNAVQGARLAGATTIIAIDRPAGRPGWRSARRPHTRSPPRSPPARRCEVFIAAPAPVSTPQPMRAAWARGTSLRDADDGAAHRDGRLGGERTEPHHLLDGLTADRVMRRRARR